MCSTETSPSVHCLSKVFLSSNSSNRFGLLGHVGIHEPLGFSQFERDLVVPEIPLVDVDEDRSLLDIGTARVRPLLDGGGCAVRRDYFVFERSVDKLKYLK